MPTASLRLRLSIAFVAVGVLAVGLATFLSTRGLEPRLTDAAEVRLAHSTDRLADATTARYRDDRRWTAAGAKDLEHLGLTTGLRAVIVRPSGRPVSRPDSPVMLRETPRGPGTTSRQLFVGGRTVGTLYTAPVNRSLLSPVDVDLRDSLDRLHMIAGAIAIAISLVAALLFAHTISSPLRRIRSTAQRMERGDLYAEIEPGGDPEVRAVAHALNRLAETLMHEDHVRRESVADLAHELRTPVSGLLSRIEAAQDGVFADPEANLSGMHAEAMRLRRLLDDLDGLAAAERPGLLLEKRPVDLAAIAESETERMAPSFAKKGVRLERELSATDVSGDPDRLAQVVSNLLSNALGYTKEGGEVRVRVGGEATGAVLEVADTGVGIEAENLEHIFKRFWRADKSRSRTTGGTGIGLAIVHELVLAHEGRIEVDSALGRGSRFLVTFPELPRGCAVAEPRTSRQRGVHPRAHAR